MSMRTLKDMSLSVAVKCQEFYLVYTQSIFLRTHDANEQINVDTQTQVCFNKYSIGPVKQKFSA